jgi:hypothetical protein
MPAVTPVKVSVAVVTPLYTPALLILLQVVPPLVLSCHWYAGLVPAAVMLKLVLDPAHMVLFAGCALMVTAVFTVSNAQDEVAAGLQVPVITQR